MKKLIAAAAALVLAGALVAASCEPADDDCDARGTGIALTAAHAGKVGSSSSGRRPSHSSGGRLSKSGGKSKTSGRTGSSHRGSHGHHDDDWLDCD